MLVYFFSDFGGNGPYSGQVEAVIRAGCGADFINLLANAPKTDPFLSAYLLAGLYSELPVKQGYLLAVVDPGVGSGRAVLKLSLDQMTFIAPDNGLLSRLVSGYPDARLEKLQDIPEDMSASFHARDWFAPVIVRLINGQSVATQKLDVADMRGNDWPNEIARVIYIDHFGNLVTGIQCLPVNKQIKLAGLPAVSHADTFSSVRKGDLFWYRNSMGLIEIAANRASASALLDVVPGSEISII